MRCGRCGDCPAFGEECSGCPGCGVLLLRDVLCFGRTPCPEGCYRCPDNLLSWRELAEAGGTLSLERGLPAFRPPEIPDLPASLPVVSSPLREPPPPGMRWFALHAEKMSRAAWEGRIDPRAQFRLPPDARTALHLYVRDRALDRFWARRRELYPALRGRFGAVLGPNFSVYDDAPRLEHLLAMRKAALCAAEMAAEGIPVVPDASWYRAEDAERWAAFAARFGFPAVAFSFQQVGAALKGSGLWASQLWGLRLLARLLPPGARVVLVGIGSPRRLAEAARILGGRPATVADTRSFVAARRGWIFRGGRRAPAPRGMPRDAAFFESAADAGRLAARILAPEGGAAPWA